jgi:hypothetical protein
MSAACTVWFYSPAKDRVTGLNVINKIVAGLDPPFCHTELQFPSGEACSIVMSGRVSMRARAFDPDFYTGVRIDAPAPAVGKALALARGHEERQTAFGVGGARTFCSKLVADLLRESGMVPEEELGRTLFISPSALFRRLQRRSSPARSQQQGPACGPIVPISFVEPALQPRCPPQYKVSPVGFGASYVHFALRCGESGPRQKEPRQNEKVPEDRRLLLAV